MTKPNWITHREVPPTDHDDPGQGQLLRGNWRHLWLILPALLILIAGFHCAREKNSVYDEFRDSRQVAQSSHDRFAQAIDYLHRLDEFDPDSAFRRVQNGLNQWIGHYDEKTEWEVDPMADQIPQEFHIAKEAVRFRRLRIGVDDVFFIQEQMFFRDIARRVATGRTNDEALGEWLKSTRIELGEDAVRGLAVCERLFDWTIRNIQLEKSPPLVRRKKAAAGPLPEEDKQPHRPKDEPVSPGPGEKYYAWEVLLSGRGDAVDRARTFILLARQQGIPVVMLGLEDDEYIEPRPWLPAVLVQDHLYLFDTRLGLPLPGPGGLGIATLQEVIDNNQLLQALDAENGEDSEFTYPVRGFDGLRVVALVDAAPHALSRRMQLVQQKLAGDKKMVLTTSPSEMASRVRQCGGLSDVQVWTLPYACIRYRKSIATDKEAVAQLLRPLAFIRQPTPLWFGRMLDFRGEYEMQDQRPGAKNRYMTSRPPTKFIRQLETDRTLQKTLKLDQLKPYARRIQIQMIADRKQAASYWLGLIAYESRELEVAVDYFQARTLEAYSDCVWTHGAQYNLARTYEAMGETDKAVRLYQQDTSPQRHGNALRAARLRRTERQAGAGG